MAKRFQSGVVPYRFNKKGELEILLISKKNGGWSMTKGGIEKDMSPIASAQKEALEEAGIIGTVESYLGSMKYVKQGQKQDVQWYLMSVTKEKNKWDESEVRERKWMTPKKALNKIDKRYAGIVKLAIKRLKPSSIKDK